MTSPAPGAPAPPAPPAERRASRRRAASAAALDAASVVVFVASGRRSHAEGLDLAGVAGTAWPFLAGAAAGWVVARAWGDPLSRRTGVVVWASAVALGQLLRVLSGRGTEVSFVVVSAVVLGVLLLGWRGLATAVASASARRTASRA